MKRNSSIITIVLVLALVAAATAGATGVQEVEEGSAPEAPDPTTVAGLVATGEPIGEVARNATGFEAVRSGRITVVTVTRPWQAATDDDALTYVLYPRDSQRPEVEDADLVVPVPVESIVSMSTTFLPHLTAIDELESLVAVDSVAYAYSPQVHNMHDEGSIMEVGSGPNVDIERLLALDADIIMVNSYDGDRDAQPVLEEAGLPVVVSGDWAETSPLGRAEWILFTALFYGELESALDLYAQIERDYNRLTALASDTTGRPTVLANAPYQGTWAVPGGASYAAQFIEDAGGSYVWADDDSTGALFFDIESVYAEAGDADAWINTGTWSSLDQAAAEDERFTNFAAFENGMLFNNNRRMGPGGGNDYFESGALNPHIILNDLIWALHPEAVPDYEPYYYQRLR
ncbi:MAG: ABC transporter substrate-binding protein [Spirochaetota bacterium]